MLFKINGLERVDKIDGIFSGDPPKFPHYVQVLDDIGTILKNARVLKNSSKKVKRFLKLLFEVRAEYQRGLKILGSKVEVSRPTPSFLTSVGAYGLDCLKESSPFHNCASSVDIH